jgi:hypothetical protein
MADNDAELRAELLAYCRAKREAYPEVFGTDENFAGYVEFVLNGISTKEGWAEGFRVHHMMFGWYPTFREFHGLRPALLPPPRS